MLAGEDQLARRLRPSHHVPQQKRRGLEVDAGQRLRRPDDLRDEGFLVDGRFADGQRFLGKDLRQRGGIGRGEMPALSDASDRLQQIIRRSVTDTDRRASDPRRSHVLRESLEVTGIGDAVGQHDDVLQLRDCVDQRLICLFHRRIKARAAADLNAADLVNDAALVRCRLQLADPVVRLVETDHPDLVLRSQQLGGSLRGLFRHLQFLSGHRPRSIHDQNHRQAWLVFFFLEVGPHRQNFFEHRLVVAAQPKRLIAAEHHEPATEVLHVRPREFHLPLSQRRRWHIRQRQQFVVLQVCEILRHSLRRPDIDLNVLLLQREPQMLDLFGIAVDQQHARLPRRKNQTVVAVVVEQRILLHPADSRGVFGEPLALNRLRKTKPVLPLLERLRFRQHFVSTAKDLDQPFVIVVRVNHDLDVKRLPFTHLSRHLDRRQLHFGIISRRQRNRRDGNRLAPPSPIRRRQRCLQRITARLIAVGQQQNPRHIIRRHRRSRRINRRRDVGPLVADAGSARTDAGNVRRD